VADVDAAVVGAGVVGLACAERMARAGMSVLILERAGSFGTETSSRNSEVLHAGLYYEPGSFKARLCVEGSRAAYAWCADHRVACRRIGKYIVSSSHGGDSNLDALAQRARENGVDDLQRVTSDAVARAEPNVRASEALWSPSTGIIDSHAFMASLLVAAREYGCDVAWRHNVVGVELADTGAYHLTVAGPGGERSVLRAARVVNAAGLDADRIAALAGIDTAKAGYEQHYVKGSYFSIKGRPLCKHLIYPLPPPDLKGLGIHLTVGLDGSNRLGPDVEFLEGRMPDYRVDEAQVDSFVEAASVYLWGLKKDMLSPDQAGIRPKLRAAAGTPRDFVITEECARALPGWVNLIGIESPGLTASLAIARVVSELLSG
jgi:L-2-hydroxyglutarate oxidase LhgO